MPLRNISFMTLEKLTDLEDFLIKCDCLSRNFFTRSSSNTIVILFDIFAACTLAYINNYAILYVNNTSY